jgi:5-methylthioadenosine/S-adenosylhomocysteine deaminase
MDPALGIIESGDLLIDRDKIIAVGRDIGSWAVREIDGRGMIAMPGFINGHIHLWQTALRGIAADWTLDQYFGVLIGKAVRLYTPQDAYIRQSRRSTRSDQFRDNNPFRLVPYRQHA